MLTHRNDPRVTRWLINTTVDPETFTRRWVEAATDPWDHSCVAFTGDQLVGSGMLEVVDGMGQGKAPETQRVEGLLGYILDPAHAGNGYATEIAALARAPSA